MTARPVTVERIDRGLEQLLRIIEKMPREERLWGLFDRLEAERERLLANENRIEAARERLKARSQRHKEARS